MRKSFVESINGYLQALKKSDWILDEEYKFVCANYVNKNVSWETQTNEEILEILINSQEKISYRNSVKKFKGVQFITGIKKYQDNYIGIKDIELFRQIRNGKNFNDVDWSDKTMSFPLLSVWLSFLFPSKIHPIKLPATKTKVDFSETISFLFGTDIRYKKGLKSIFDCQFYMKETEKILRQYPVENYLLKTWNQFYSSNPALKITSKQNLEKVDWIWLVQDFHLFVQREILEPNYKGKSEDYKTTPDFEIKDDEIKEGRKRLVTHIQYERNPSLIKEKKDKAFQKNKMLNCEVCGFSFLYTYGEVGIGFIEAHHIKPLSEREGEEEEVTKVKDLALVCSNCHKMLHKGDPAYSIEELKDKISRNI